MTWKRVATAGAVLLLSGGFAQMAGAASKPEGAPVVEPMPALVVPILDGDGVIGQLRLRYALRLAPTAERSFRAVDPHVLRDAHWSAAASFASLHASPDRAPVVPLLARSLDQASATVGATGSAVLIEEVRVEPS